jgi:hypothetical protein
MDRLAAFYHWNDAQGLEQAVAVGRQQRIACEPRSTLVSSRRHGDEIRRLRAPAEERALIP